MPVGVFVKFYYPHFGWITSTTLQLAQAISVRISIGNELVLISCGQNAICIVPFEISAVVLGIPY